MNEVIPHSLIKDIFIKSYVSQPILGIGRLIFILRNFLLKEFTVPLIYDNPFFVPSSLDSRNNCAPKHIPSVGIFFLVLPHQVIHLNHIQRYF